MWLQFKTHGLRGYDIAVLKKDGETISLGTGNFIQYALAEAIAKAIKELNHVQMLQKETSLRPSTSTPRTSKAP